MSVKAGANLLLAAVLASMIPVSPALPQSPPQNPPMTYGMVPTTGQWINWFQQKQDATGNLGTQSANTVYAGPLSGSATTPTFRALAPADLPGVQFVATSTQFGTSLCSGSSPCPIGTGGDDSVPLNAISAACQAAGSCTIVIPNGVTLNVCSAAWSLPNVAPISVVLQGNGRAAGGVRILPGCRSSPTTVVQIPGITGSNPNSVSSAHFSFRDMRIDGSCLANHDIEIDYSAFGQSDFTSYNSMYRNVVPSTAAASLDGGSNVYIGSVFNAYMDASNWIENANDQVSTCYGAYSAGSTANYGKFPPYGLDFYGFDSIFGINHVGASIAGIVDRYNSDVQFDHAHPWGYIATNASSQPFSEPQYDFITRAGGYFTYLELDSPAKAGIRAQGLSGSNGVDTITGVTNAGSGGTPGAVTVLTGVSGTGTKWTGIGIIGPSGSLSSIPWVTYGGVYSANPNLTGETVTATNGLTGVVVNLLMGTGSFSGVGPIVQGVNSFNTPYVFELGQGLSTFVALGNDFTSKSTGCFSYDSGATTPGTFAVDKNIACTDAVYKALPNTGTCAATATITRYTENFVTGVFQASGACVAGTWVFSTAGILANQKDGYTCTANDLSTPANIITESTATYNSFTLKGNAANTDYIGFTCNGY